eukprot:CAMPEP_0173400942 /NCGR_PEP_ID=MMETSP1356-20130122/49487_1 /TAXON_ID=77927 ORGANISM="Hemiselmis virescens, Strain PCC157" /NCGR_SAMPLE_ID=MMETSP1356 /ASSEMBLY_ACC=CAM_ASM_000847 /LENGTH=418 /DNA_ID=CAMNT_0014360977 /DNA_START=55 /DNA_END=1311 /DNA_ORIENTATION=-
MTFATRVLRQVGAAASKAAQTVTATPKRIAMPPGGYESEEARPKLFIPGPIEFSPEVLHAFSKGARAHTDATIIEEFGQCIEMSRECFITKDAQPFILSGSGALGWDAVACNFLQPGERGLVLASGHFSDRFIDCFVQYQCDITIIDAPTPGARPDNDAVEKALSDAVKEGKPYKLITITGVDTSTAVLADLKKLCQITQAVSPKTLIVVDAVCSAIGEELRMDEWGIDFVHTASQKAIGVPAGLAIMIASQRAMASLPPKHKIPNSFANLQNWLPIMQNYEARKPSYFATPATNTIGALRVGYDQILATPGGIEGYFKQHRDAQKMVHDAIHGMGLKLLTASPDIASNLLSCVRYPEGKTAPDVLPEMKKKGWIIAAGLHPKCAAEYFRIGHMAYSTSGRVDYLPRLLADLKTVLGR